MIRDGEARARAVAHAGSIIVQAPAGSGKTTLLAQRYLRLLAAVDAPERVLALTFTRKAAYEMRERVLTALRAAELDECPALVSTATWTVARAAMRQMQSVGIDLAQHPARLRIETIDAFNGWLAAQLPLSASTGGAPRVLRDPQAAYREAASRALAHSEADAYGAAVERVLVLGDQRWPELVRLIAAMLPARDRWLPLLAGGLELAAAVDEAQLARIRRQFDADLALLVEDALQQAERAVGPERLAALSRILHDAARGGGAATPPLEAWRSDASPPHARSEDIPRWRALATILLTKSGEIRARVTKTEGFGPGHAHKPAMQALLEELARDPSVAVALEVVRTLPEPAYGDAEWDRVRDVAHVLILAAAQLDRVFRERAGTDFPAVSMAARRALGPASAPTDLALCLDYRLQHILVDEFQDTSGAQLELLRLLTAGWQQGDGRSAFCVGDPMQSIYGFRDAEVGAFLRLAEDGIGETRFEPLLLTSNFRSVQPLVAWINRVFSRLFPPLDDRDRGAIAYRPSESVLPDSAESPGGVSYAGYATRIAEAQAVAEFIAACAARHPQWRIAVLVRARTHAREVAAGLRRLGCAFRAVDLVPLQDRLVVRDLVTLTRALLHFGDRTAWLGILRAPWTGLKLADLLQVARAGPVIWNSLRDDAVLARLSDDGRQRCLRVRGVLQDTLPLRGHASFTRWVERTWLALGGPGCLAQGQDLRHAQAALLRLRELEASGLPDPADFDAAFADLYAGDDTAAAVEIMTIHKAKGLEFDLVVVPGLDRTISPQRDEFLLSRQFAGPRRDCMVIAARPPAGAADDRLFTFLRNFARESAALEAERLLYVACTRAKRRLHLTASVGEPTGSAVRAPKSGSLLAVLWPLVAAEFAPEDAASDAPLPPPSPEPAALCRVPRDWSPPQYTAAFELEAPAPDTAARTPAPVFDWAGETARHVGSLVHAQLQTLQPDPQGIAAIRARLPQFERWLALRGVPQELLAEAGQRAVRALVAVLDDPRGRWILQRHGADDWREQALSGVWSGRVVRIVIDRCFVDALGIRWVIDYKTSEHTGAGEKEFLDREVERYASQMQRYAAFARRMGPQPVRAGLYFPLLRAWREWPVSS